MNPLISLSHWVVWGQVLAATTLAAAQVSVAPIQWQRVYGGTETEHVRAMVELPDGGWVLGVSSYSGPSGNKFSPLYSTSYVPDYWVIRLDAQGDLVWEKSFGGSGLDYMSGLALLGDGSILAGGESMSPISGNKTTSRPSTHAWLLCLDEQGEKLWEKSLGGNGNDSLASVNGTRDGGAICVMVSRSETGGDKSAELFGASDFWIVRLNAGGEMVWDRAFGGSDNDSPLSIRQASGGGFIAVGMTRSGADGNKTSPSYGNGDYWVLRLDAQGNKLWECALGGSERDEGRDVQETVDGGFLVFGTSSSGMSGNKTAAPHGEQDYWIVKLDAHGNILWDRAAGGTSSDSASMACKTSDGGFLLCGYTYATSTGGTITSTNHGTWDTWMLRLNEHGQELWQQHYGGVLNDQFEIVMPAKDGGYVLAVSSGSEADGNKTVASFGRQDAWVLKLRPDVVMLRSLVQKPSQVREEGFRLQLSGPTNGYAVEYSTNLTQWEVLQNVALTNNAVELIDPAATTSPSRIYRARVNPEDAP